MTNTPRTQADSILKTTPDGLKKSLHGNLYQLSLLTLAALKASESKEVEKFYLYSEAKEHEKFDDLVIDYGDSITFLQAKHASEDREYTKEDFLKGYVDNNDASLAKYFDSWYKLKNSEYCKDESGQSKSSKYIFFTNRGVKNEGDFLENTSNDDKIILEGIEGKTLKFKSGDSRDEFIDAIKANSSEVGKVDSGDFSIANVSTECKKEVQEYLKKKRKAKGTLNIDFRSKLSIKTMAFLKICVQNEGEFDKIFSGDDNKELRNIFSKLKNNIKVNNINNLKHPFSNVLNIEINEFLDALIIKVGQPDNLAKNIYRELREKDELTIGVSDMQSYLHSKMFDWLADAKTTVLSMDSFGKMIEKKLGDLYRYYLLGATEDYKHLHEKGNENIRIADLKYPLVNKLTIVKDEGGGALEQRVYNSVCRNNVKLIDAEWFFMDIGSRYLKQIPRVAKGAETKFIIINCRDVELNDEQKGYITQFIQGEKSVILLTSKGIAIGNQESKTYKIQRLEKGEIDRIRGDNHYFYIGGRKYSFENIMGSHEGTGLDKAMRNFDSLQQMLEQKKPERNLALAALPYDVYVKNNLKKGIPKYSFASFLTEHSVKYLIVKDKSKSDLRKKLEKNLKIKEGNEIAYRFTEDVEDPDKEKVRFVDSVTGTEDDECRFICTAGDITELPENSVVLEFQDDGTVKIIDKKSPKALPAASSYDFEDKDNKNIISREDDSLVRCDLAIISAKAGLGKSSFCLNEIMQCEQEGEQILKPLWVVRVNLPRIKVKEEEKIGISSVLNEKVTGQKWYEWQIEALQNDMQNGNKKNVRFFLDGFDEIKNENNIKKVNDWINELQAKEGISILITTRPYAANKIALPSGCKPYHYIRLNPYSEDQQKEYVKKYVQAIVDNIDADILEKITTNIDKIIKEPSNNLRDILGIPLESYIFCEVLRDDIIKCASSDTSEGISGIKGLSTIELYQKFIKVKLETFFIKHVFCDKEEKHKTLGQFELHNDSIISQRKRLYTFSFLYREILMTYAYNQAFSSERQALYSAYYTDEIVEDIKEMGIATIEKREDGGYNILFHHETYQEYFAALAIFKGLILSDGKDKEIREKIEESRYNPKFRVIMQMLAQLSMFGDPLLPNYDKEKDFGIVWRALAENGDILGAAAGSLFMDCMKELLDDKINLLKEFVEQHKETWGKELLIAINRKGNNSEKASHSTDVVFDNPVQYPEEVVVGNREMDDGTRGKLKKEFNEKTQVFEATTTDLKDGFQPKDLAKIFKDVLEENKLSCQYWDIFHSKGNGGIDSIFLLENGITEYLADYIIKRISGDSSWRAPVAARAMMRLNTKRLESDKAKKQFNKILQALVRHREHVDNIYQLLSKFHTSNMWQTFFEEVNNNLPGVIPLRELCFTSFRGVTGFEDFTNKIINLAWCGVQLKTPFIARDKKLFIQKEKEDIEVRIGDEFFAEVFLNFIKELEINKGEEAWRNLLVDNIIRNCYYKNILPQRIDELVKSTKSDSSLYFELWGKLGKSFSKDIVDQFIDCISSENKGKLLNVLIELRGALYKENLTDPEYDEARQAFNYCMSKIKFVKIVNVNINIEKSDLKIEIKKQDGQEMKDSIDCKYMGEQQRVFVFQNLQQRNNVDAAEFILEYRFYKDLTLEERRAIFKKLKYTLEEERENKNFKRLAENYNDCLEENGDLKKELSPINLEEPDVEMAEAEEEKEEESKKRKASSSSCSSEMESKRRKDDDEDDSPASDEKGKGKKRSLSSAESAAAKKVKESDKSSGSTSGASGTKQSTLATVLNREISHNFIYNSSVTINMGGEGRCKLTCVIQQNYFNTKTCNRQISV